MMHYTHAIVRLHCWRVTEWHGEMQGMEGQQFEWQRIEALTVSPTLPGCVPIFAALKLPLAYLISNASELGVVEYLKRLEVFLKDASGPMPLIQIREKSMSATELESFAKNVVSLAHAHGAKVLVNADEALARRVGADGVHLTSMQLAALEARPDFELVGVSTHTRAELDRAGELKCDFAVLGPVQKTLTHPDQAPLGWPRFAEMALNTPVPCYALGGLSLSDMSLAVAHGAQGLAIQRGLN
jgi:8-oxo-dGTP diphosphatase